MKKLIVIVTVLIVALVSNACRQEIDENLFNVKGKVINEITKVGIPAYEFTLLEQETTGSGIFSIVKVVNSKAIKTDANGNFNVAIDVKSNSNGFEFSSGMTDNYTPIQNSRHVFNNINLLSEALLFNVRNWEKLEIKVKNTQPFDENDEIRVSVFEDNTHYIGQFITKITNNGVKNIGPGYPASDNGLNPHWIGKNVDSKIYFNLQNGTQYTIFYDVKKNGIWTNYVKSPTFSTQSGQINYYTLEY